MTAHGTGTVASARQVDRAPAAPAHPALLYEGVVSPNQMAQRLGEPLGSQLHVKILLENDAIELVATRPVRGDRALLPRHHAAVPRRQPLGAAPARDAPHAVRPKLE